MIRLTNENDDLTFMCNYLKEKTVFDSDRIKAIHEKLKAYEDLEEQGLLIKLPCKVGDRAYRIIDNEIEVLMVGKLILNSIGIIAVFIKKDGRTFNDYTILFGDIYFITREEAEKALESCQ